MADNRTPRTTSAAIKTPRIVRLLGGNVRLAANEEEPEVCAGDLTEADVDRIVAEMGEGPELLPQDAAQRAQAFHRANDARALKLQIDRAPNGGYLHG